MNRLFRSALAIVIAWAFLVVPLAPASALVPQTYAGVTAPTNPQFGQTWIDLSTSPATFRDYDGTSWVALGTLNGTTHVYTPAVSFGMITGTLLATQSPAYTGDVASSIGVTTTTIQPNVVTNAKAAQAPALTIKSNITGATANEADNALSAIIDAAIGNTRGAVLERGASGWALVAPGASSTVLTSNGVGADPSYAFPGALIVAPRSNVRQTVQGGPVSAGTPSFLPTTSASLSVTAQNITSGAPLTISAAQGFNATGQADLVLPVTTNPTWSGLVASQTVSSATATATATTFTTSAVHNLVVGSTVTVSGASQTAINGAWVVASVPSTTTFTINGTFTAGSVTGSSYTVTNFLFLNASSGATSTALPIPAYQFGGTIGTAAGQFTFDYQGFFGYLGNGSTAPATPLVAVGECAASASTLTSCVAYAYNGYYESPVITTLPAPVALTVYSSNLGVKAQGVLDCELAVNLLGYIPGEKTDPLNYDGTYLSRSMVSTTRNTITWTASTSSTLYIHNKTTGGLAGYTTGNTSFILKLIERRGWGGA